MNVENSKKIISGIIALLALLPSLAILLDFVELPPTQEEILRITIFTVSIGTVLIVFLAAPAIRRLPLPRMLFLNVTAFICGIASLFAYQEASDTFYKTCSKDGNEIGIVLPLEPGPIQSGYGQFGLCGLAQDDPNLAGEIESSNRMTRLILAMLLAIAQFGITAGVILGVVRLQANPTE